eukprot:2250983-Pleurochrysis_carterae.AAC.1
MDLSVWLTAFAITWQRPFLACCRAHTAEYLHPYGCIGPFPSGLQQRAALRYDCLLRLLSCLMSVIVTCWPADVHRVYLPQHRHLDCSICGWCLRRSI